MMASQLFVGLLSKRYGRKPVLIISILLCLTGSIIISTSSMFFFICLGFVIQALGVGSLAAVNTNVVTDVFKGSSAHQIFNLVTIMIAAACIIAPIVATSIAFYYNWQSSFLFTAAMAFLLTLYNGFFIKETSSVRCLTVDVMDYIKKIISLITCFNKKDLSFFPAICVFSGLYSGGVIASYSNIAMLLSVQFHRDIENIGQLFALGSIIYLFGIMASSWLSKWFRLRKIIRVSLYITILNTLTLAVRNVLIPNLGFSINIILFFFLLHFFLINFVIGILSPCTLSLALEPFSKSGEHTEEASSALMFSRNLFTVLIGVVVAYLDVTSTLPLALTLLILFIFSTGFFEFYCRRVDVG